MRSLVGWLSAYLAALVACGEFSEGPSSEPTDGGLEASVALSPADASDATSVSDASSSPGDADTDSDTGADASMSVLLLRLDFDVTACAGLRPDSARIGASQPGFQSMVACRLCNPDDAGVAKAAIATADFASAGPGRYRVGLHARARPTEVSTVTAELAFDALDGGSTLASTPVGALTWTELTFATDFDRSVSVGQVRFHVPTGSCYIVDAVEVTFVPSP